MNAQAMKLAELSPEQIAALYRKVFGGVDGELVLEHLRLACFVYVLEDVGAEKDRDVFINMGKRAVILHIETQMRPGVEHES